MANTTIERLVPPHHPPWKSPVHVKGCKSRSQHNFTNYLLDLERSLSSRMMSQDGASHLAASNGSKQSQPLPSEDSEHSLHLTKAYLNASLTTIYEKLVNKLEKELHKTTCSFPQEIASIGGRIDMLETKHDKLTLAHNDLRKDYEILADSFSFMKTWTTVTGAIILGYAVSPKLLQI